MPPIVNDRVAWSVGLYVMPYCAKLTGENLSRYWNKIERVGLGKA